MWYLFLSNHRKKIKHQPDFNNWKSDVKIRWNKFFWQQGAPFTIKGVNLGHLWYLHVQQMTWLWRSWNWKWKQLWAELRMKHHVGRIVGLSTVKASFLRLCVDLNNSNSLKPLKYSSEPLFNTSFSVATLSSSWCLQCVSWCTCHNSGLCSLEGKCRPRIS